MTKKLKQEVVEMLVDTSVDTAADGLVEMWRDGERCEVDVASGSVEIMAELGWSVERGASR